MANQEVRTQPYELMVRWGRDGAIQGYHVVPVHVLCEELEPGVWTPVKDPETGENLLESFGVATTLEKAGLDLSDLLGAGLQAALVARDRYLEERDQARAERDDAIRAKEAAEAELAALKAQQPSESVQ